MPRETMITALSFARDLDETIDKIREEIEKVRKRYLSPGRRVWVSVYYVEKSGGYGVDATDVSLDQARASPEGYVMPDGSAIYFPPRALFRMAKEFTRLALKGTWMTSCIWKVPNRSSLLYGKS